MNNSTTSTSQTVSEQAVNNLKLPTPAVDQATVIDLKALRLSQNYVAQAGVQKQITTVPVRKPHKQEFIRIHPSADYRMPAATITLKDDNETYLVVPTLIESIGDECVPTMLFTVINRQGVLSLWPIRLPREDGRIDDYNRSAMDIAVNHATESWVKVVANRFLGAYEVFMATANHAEPEWPTISFDSIINIAFKGRIIDSLDHPVLKRLRGEV